MNTAEPNALARFVADRLDGRADAIIMEWTNWVRSRSENSTVDPRTHWELHDYVAPVLSVVARHVLKPSISMRDEILAHLKRHGRVRRDQGYAATDLLLEFEGLSHMVFRTMRDEVEAQGEPYPPGETLEVFGRLADSLRAMSYVILAANQQTAEERHLAMAMCLADFGRAIGHGLRNPLNTIAIGAQVLHNLDAVKASEVGVQQLAAIEAAVKRAASLIDAIDVLSLAQGGDSRSRMVALPKLLEDVRMELGAQAKVSDVTLHWPECIPQVAVEGQVATLALVTVCTNAIKYSDASEDERWVDISLTLITEHGPPLVEILVKDNGIGIPADLQPHVFQRGFRAHPGYSTGTGLGLAITRELLTERGGGVELDSSEGRGTQVRIVLRALGLTPEKGVVDEGTSAEALMDHSMRMLREEGDDFSPSYFPQRENGDYSSTA